MRKPRSIFRYLFRRQEVESDLDRELRYHIDRQTELNMQRGMTPQEARRQAVLSVGGVEPVKDDCRDARAGRTIEILLQDIRYGLRVLRKNPGYSLAAILTLALGIGANTAIFSLVYGVFLRPLPYRAGGQLVVLAQQSGKNRADTQFTPIEVAAYGEHCHTLRGVVEHHSMSFLLLGKDTADRVETSVVSANFFDVLGVRPLLGRTFLPSDTPTSGAVLVMSYKYWQRRHRGDPNIVGKVFQMNDLATTVIGVLPPVPQYPVESDVYMPTWQCPSRSSPRNIANANFRLISAVFGRLKSGVTVEQARAELGVAAAQVSAAHPEGYRTGGFAVSAAPLHWALTRKAETPFLILLAVAGFVLLIACANVANMMLARLLKLERELAVRAALGASRARLIYQLLTESVLVSAAGGAIGLAIAPLALQVLVGFAERFTTRAAEVRVDGPILLYAVILSAGAGLLFGLAPALSPWQHVDSLHQGGRATANRSRQILRGGLVIAQVAVSFILLIGAGLMIRSFVRIERQNPGFDPSRLLSMRVSLSASSGNEFRKRVTEITRQARALPGVEAAALISNAPFSKTNVTFGPGSDEFEIEGRPSSKGEGATVDTTVVQEGYFETVRQPLVRGRTFTEHDNEQSPRVAVINETMARHRWPAEDPVARRVTFDHGETWLKIVGVVGDAHEYGLDRHVADEMYFPLGQGHFANSLVVRTTGDPGRMLSLVRAAIHELDPYIALDQISTTDSLQYESMASPRLMTILLGLFAGLAVLISATGIAAVMALAVRQRTNELGIRMALGAQRSRIVTMVVKQGLVLALAGTAFGIAGAIALTRLLKALLYDTSPTDLATFCAVSLLFLTVAAVACFIPARQVTAIDPLHALRQE